MKYCMAFFIIPDIFYFTDINDLFISLFHSPFQYQPARSLQTSWCYDSFVIKHEMISTGLKLYITKFQVWFKTKRRWVTEGMTHAPHIQQ